jgi:hypothetical protein
MGVSPRTARCLTGDSLAGIVAGRPKHQGDEQDGGMEMLYGTNPRLVVLIGPADASG